MIDYGRRRRKKELAQKGKEAAMALHELLQAPCHFSSAIAKVDPFNAFPIQMEPYMHDLLTFCRFNILMRTLFVPNGVSSDITAGYRILYSVEKYTNYNPLTSHWIPFAFQSAAMMHAILGCADTATTAPWNHRLRPTAIKHLNAAIHIVNKSLAADPPTITDSIIAVVSTIAVMEEVSGHHDNWKVHMKGLYQLVKIRGGLVALKSNPLLLDKIHRADLAGAVDALETPYFAANWDSSCLLTTPAIPFRNGRFTELERTLPFDDRIRSLITAFEATIESLNQLHAGDTEVDPTNLRANLTSMQYTLLSMGFDDRPNEFCRLSLILFLASIFNELPQGHVLGNDKLRMKARSLLDDTSSLMRANESNLDILVDFRLWIMFLAASTIFNHTSPLKEWYLKSIAVTASTAGILDCSWDDMRNRVSTFLYITSVHSFAFEDVWQAAQRGSSIWFPRHVC
ncbi:hypothetical protein AJ80_00635 [Polytolypa hystricis UAMH7299]|uniref:Transcription factor domain-containing protein n=1 Tax=Polytolypa hystricis (strain UAMH7299) TaxID=1447883 RepID=A0A2B7Z3I6_POLH7|nr:hypothetical protein AJ80_00635 [Polytolypa hystricis UAMH7299]